MKVEFEVGNLVRRLRWENWKYNVIGAATSLANCGFSFKENVKSMFYRIRWER